MALCPADLNGMFYAIGGLVIGGGLTHFFKKYTEQVDAQEKTLPVVISAIETIEKSITAMKDSITELYASRNEHTTLLVKIDTLHEVKGCIKKGN